MDYIDYAIAEIKRSNLPVYIYGGGGNGKKNLQSTYTK